MRLLSLICRTIFLGRTSRSGVYDMLPLRAQIKATISSEVMLARRRIRSLISYDARDSTSTLILFLAAYSDTARNVSSLAYSIVRRLSRAETRNIRSTHA